MNLPGRKRRTTRPWAITAAARRVRDAGRNGQKAKQAAPWQARAFDYYDRIGELHFAAGFYRELAKLTIHVERVNDQGEWERVETGDASAAAALVALARIPDDSRPALFGNYGLNRFLTGEANLVVSVEPIPEAVRGDERAALAEAAEERWEMLSVLELKRRAGGYDRVVAEGKDPVKYADPPADADALEPGQMIAYRLWRPHPRRSDEADSPLKGVLDDCEEVLLLNQAIRTKARSRAGGAGVFIIPEEVSPPPVDADGDEDPEADPFLEDFTAALTAGLEDETSAATTVPMLIRVREASIDKFRLIRFSDGEYPEVALRKESVERMARGVDLPQEVILGMADANHWTAWQIDDATWEAHLEPVAMELVSDLTQVYYRPALRAEGLDAEEASRYRVWFDASGIVNHPNRTTDAKDVHDRGAISDMALREAAGFADDDAPTIEAPNSNPRVIAAQNRASGPGAPPADPVDGGEDVEGGPPGGDQAALVAGAAAVALERCRELAGSRLLTAIQRDRGADLRGLSLQDVPKSRLAARLGMHGWEVDRSLVCGGAACLRSTLVSFGMADQAGRIASLVEDYAARTLLEEAPAPLPLEAFDASRP